MIIKAEFTEAPEKILFESDRANNRVWLRKDIAEEKREAEGNEYSVFTASEVYFETSVDKATIEADFDSWFALGESWTPESAGGQTIEERITNLENAMLAMLGV